MKLAVTLLVLIFSIILIYPVFAQTYISVYYPKGQLHQSHGQPLGGIAKWFKKNEIPPVLRLSDSFSVRGDC